MTRACQALILAGTASRAAAERWSKQGTTPPVPRELLSAKSYLDWIGPWLGEATGRIDWADCPTGSNGVFGWRIYQDDDLLTASQPNASLEPTAAGAPGSSVNPAVLKAVQERLAWQYPFEIATAQPAKASVSTLRLGIVAQVEDEPPRPRPRLVPLSNAAQGSGLSAAEVGVAHHTFLQTLPLDQPDRLEFLQAQAEQLEQAGILSPAEKAALDLKAIAAFWRSQIGQELLEQRSYLQRELPFTFRLPLSEALAFRKRHIAALEEAFRQDARASRLAAQRDRRGEGTDPKRADGAAGEAYLDQEFLVVTGVVDLVALLPKEIWLLDFKTDAVTAKDWKQKAALYAPQMQLYSMALSRIYQRPVTRCWLHSLVLSRTLECAG
jgi:ATP-dependent helicase/nuclease subunit A